MVADLDLVDLDLVDDQVADLDLVGDLVADLDLVALDLVADLDLVAALHRSYRELARHYGCRIDPAPPQSPEKKGRVEAGVGYLRRNFLPTVTDRDGSRVAEALQRARRDCDMPARSKLPM